MTAPALTWAWHPSGLMAEAAITSPRLLAMGCRRAQVWFDADAGRWMAGIMELDADGFVDGPDAGMALVAGWNGSNHEVRADYTDSMGRLWSARCLLPELEERIEADVELMRRDDPGGQAP